MNFCCTGRALTIMRILTNGFATNLPKSSRAPQGGTENFARAFINHILSSGAEHHWTGVILEGVDTTHIRLRKIYESTYRQYFRFYMPRPIINLVTQTKRKDVKPHLAWAKAIERLTVLVQEQKPDVVFLNGYGFLNYMLLKAAERAGVPVVIQHAGIWNKELEINKHRYTPQGRILLEDMEREITNIAAVEIFLNKWSRDYFWKHVARSKPRNTEIVPLPFDFSTFIELSKGGKIESPFKFDKKLFHIGVIARFDKIKNHPAVLGLAKAASKKKLPWQFHVVTEVPDAKPTAAFKRDYKRYVDLVAPMDRGHIARFCQSMDLILVPSLFDVSPTVVLEAIALGTPVVISPNVGYVSEFSEHGGKNWIVDPSNPTKALRDIAKIKGKPMPPALKKYLENAHNHARVFNTYLEIFREAPLRMLPIQDVFRVLWRQEVGKYIPKKK